MNEADETLLQKASEAVFGRVGDGSVFSLPWPRQVVAIIYSAQAIIDNGGFVYFFENDWPDQPPYSVFQDAYHAIGADECAECLEVAASLFPFPDPHRAKGERRAFLREHCHDETHTLVCLGGRVIDHSDANFTLLARYVRTHFEEIHGA